MKTTFGKQVELEENETNPRIVVILNLPGGWKLRVATMTDILRKNKLVHTARSMSEALRWIKSQATQN